MLISGISCIFFKDFFLPFLPLPDIVSSCCYIVSGEEALAVPS
jgi:hypothetical protein